MTTLEQLNAKIKERLDFIDSYEDRERAIVSEIRDLLLSLDHSKTIKVCKDIFECDKPKFEVRCYDFPDGDPIAEIWVIIKISRDFKKTTGFGKVPEVYFKLMKRFENRIKKAVPDVFPFYQFHFD